MDINTLDYASLHGTQKRIAERQVELEEAALAVLQSRPLFFGWRLVKTGLGLSRPVANLTARNTE
jgi:hypothetical protein